MWPECDERWSKTEGGEGKGEEAKIEKQDLARVGPKPKFSPEDLQNKRLKEEREKQRKQEEKERKEREEREKQYEEDQKKRLEEWRKGKEAQNVNETTTAAPEEEDEYEERDMRAEDAPPNQKASKTAADIGETPEKSADADFSDIYTV